MDFTSVLFAVIFTLLAVVVATSLLNGSSRYPDFAWTNSGHRADSSAAGAKLNGHVASPVKKKKKAEYDWSEMSGSSHEHWDVVKTVLSNEGAAESPDLNVESNSNNCFKYLPGKSRSHHLQRMMSKDELEEEQRVQREQLAAIFELLKENQETFGDVSQGDIDEQLKLYSI